MYNYLKAWRNCARLTQTQLSDYSGVSKATISMVERDQHPPTHATMEKLASALSLSPHFRKGIDVNDIWPDYEGSE